MSGKPIDPSAVFADLFDGSMPTIDITARTDTYDFERLMESASLIKCSEFGEAIVKHIG